MEKRNLCYLTNSEKQLQFGTLCLTRKYLYVPLHEECLPKIRN